MRKFEDYAFLTIENQQQWSEMQHLCFNADPMNADFFRMSRGRKFRAYSKNLKTVYAEGVNKDRRRKCFVWPMYLVSFKDLPADMGKEVLEQLNLPHLMDDHDQDAARAPKSQLKRMRRPAAADGRR